MCPKSSTLFYRYPANLKTTFGFFSSGDLKVKITVLLLVMYAKPFCPIVPLKSLRDHQNLPLCHRFRWLLEQITVAQYKFKFFGFLKLPILLKFYKLTFYMDPSRLFKNLDPALKHFVYHVPNLRTCPEDNYIFSNIKSDPCKLKSHSGSDHFEQKIVKSLFLGVKHLNLMFNNFWFRQDQDPSLPHVVPGSELKLNKLKHCFKHVDSHFNKGKRNVLPKQHY